MQVLDLDNIESARLKIYEHKSELLAEVDTIDPILKKFGGGARDLEVRSGELGGAVNSGGNVAAAAQQMFDACKNCHDQFRKPEKK